jgi:hypothetical protein
VKKGDGERTAKEGGFVGVGFQTRDRESAWKAGVLGRSSLHNRTSSTFEVEAAIQLTTNKMTMTQYQARKTSKANNSHHTANPIRILKSSSTTSSLAKPIKTSALLRQSSKTPASPTKLTELDIHSPSTRSSTLTARSRKPMPPSKPPSRTSKRDVRFPSMSPGTEASPCPRISALS